MPKKNQPGCPCCNGRSQSCPTKICVTACGLPIPSATVTVTAGGRFIATCTTGADGCCTLKIGVSGTYTVSASASGWASSSGSYSLRCQGMTTVALSPPSGYICDCTPYCGIIRTSLTGSDGLGTFPLTWNGSGWTGCAMRMLVDVCYVTSTCQNPTVGTIMVPILFTFFCVELGLGYQLSGAIPFCYTGGQGPYGSGYIAGVDCSYVPGAFLSYINVTAGFGLPTSCRPFAWAKTSGSFCNAAGQCYPRICGAAYFGFPCDVYGCGPVTWSVTE